MSDTDVYTEHQILMSRDGPRAETINCQIVLGWFSTMIHKFKWVKITYIDLIWDQTLRNLDVSAAILFPITVIDQLTKRIGNDYCHDLSRQRVKEYTEQTE